MNQKQKQTLYLPLEMAQEIVAEAKRLKMGRSRMVQLAVRLAMAKIKTFPGIPVIIEARA